MTAIRCITGFHSDRKGRVVCRFSDGTSTSYARLVAALARGRALGPGEFVHHLDGDCSNDDPSNLHVCSSHAEHAAFHHPRLNVNGGLIRQTRKASNLTSTRLAATVGITSRALDFIEAGTRQPKIETLMRIAESLGEPYTWFIDGEVKA